MIMSATSRSDASAHDRPALSAMDRAGLFFSPLSSSRESPATLTSDGADYKH